ncbi:arsenate reductase (glutaredoxin) [Planctobacterium marinum]|uniref:Arsenate reductase n=1 Tax=Planctobacterium marinum TaxID=1631968 RepID=A0AA48KSN8_9ALTE|nr:arsenate reductase [Planctobacterium marinum]
MSKVTILHNPRCSKSRQTLALLEDKGITAEVIEYLKEPLTAEQLTVLKFKLGLDSFLAMMRTKEAEFAEAGLSKTTSTEEQLLDAIVQYPKLLERPVVITEQAARIGRPPEQVLDLF